MTRGLLALAWLVSVLAAGPASAAGLGQSSGAISIRRQSAMDGAGTLDLGVCITLQDGSGNRSAQYCGNGVDAVIWKTQAGATLLTLSATGVISSTGNVLGGAGITAATGFYSTNGTYNANGNSSTSVIGGKTDGAAATGVLLTNSNTLTADHTRFAADIDRGGGNHVMRIYTDGTMLSAQEFLVDKVSSGIGAGSLLATGTNYSGWKFSTPWTLTHMSVNVTTASAATAANTVFTATDGTNTCTFTFACNTVTNTTGVKDVAAANGAGTGCVYAAAALVTLSVTTQGCATAVTTNSITTWGKPQ